MNSSDIVVAFGGGMFGAAAVGARWRRLVRWASGYRHDGSTEIITGGASAGLGYWFRFGLFGPLTPAALHAWGCPATAMSQRRARASWVPGVISLPG